jgi:hypothetical protein
MQQEKQFKKPGYHLPDITAYCDFVAAGARKM